MNNKYLEELQARGLLELGNRYSIIFSLVATTNNRLKLIN